MLTWSAVVAVFLLMSIGNVVSATGSGLACPDWPLCHGQLIPPMRPDVLIEYSHRLVAAVSSILIIATVIMAIRRSGQPVVRRMGFTLIVLLFVQIALGGITVLLKLPDLISTAHLVNALLIFAGLLVLAAAAQGPGAAVEKIARLSRVGLAVLLVQLALGGYVRHSGAGLACPDFPLCSGDVLPGHFLGVVHFTHRWLGILLLGFFAHLAMAGRGTAVATPSMLTLVIALLQVCLGVAAVLLRLDPPVRAAHAAVGYLLWATLVWTAARSGGLSALTAPRGRPSAVAGARLA